MPRVPFEWDEDIVRLGERVDDFFDRVFGLASAPRYVLSHAWRPAVDIYEVEGGVVVVAELPGVDESELGITVENERLRIAGARPLPPVADCKQPLQLEIEHGPFERVVALPGLLDADRVRARFKNGLLVIHVPLRPDRQSVKVRVTEEP